MTDVKGLRVDDGYLMNQPVPDLNQPGEAARLTDGTYSSNPLLTAPLVQDDENDTRADRPYTLNQLGYDEDGFEVHF